MTLIQSFKDLPAKYGIACFVVIQTLGWISFAAIYACLQSGMFDAASLLESFGFDLSFVQMARSSGGTFALAFALNRLLAPIRIMITLFVLPWVAQPINSICNPWVAMLKEWWAGSNYVEGQEEKGEDQKQKGEERAKDK